MNDPVLETDHWQPPIDTIPSQKLPIANSAPALRHVRFSLFGAATTEWLRRERDLLLRKPRLLHRFDLQTEAGLSPIYSPYEWIKIWG